mmetsp:Transcript_115993/g.328262  ORF Transcript_115993/g.328262 Transcript_115993/m.328262 type:complete len:239 (-) Transcript_115993:370-1086(-)
MPPVHQEHASPHCEGQDHEGHDVAERRGALYAHIHGRQPVVALCASAAERACHTWSAATGTHASTIGLAPEGPTADKSLPAVSCPRSLGNLYFQRIGDAAFVPEVEIIFVRHEEHYARPSAVLRRVAFAPGPYWAGVAEGSSMQRVVAPRGTQLADRRARALRELPGRAQLARLGRGPHYPEEAAGVTWVARGAPIRWLMHSRGACHASAVDIRLVGPRRAWYTLHVRAAVQPAALAR